MMTEENFFDMFNRIHNPDYYYDKKTKTQEAITNYLIKIMFIPDLYP